MRYTHLCLCILLVINTPTYASESEQVKQLETIEVYAQKEKINGLAFDESKKASDVIIKREKLQGKSATLGNALSGERSVHSNPFGGGASAPIIRGQEGVRVKVLQNGTDVVDMSNVSPDHAVAVDTLLANQVELVRGSATLMYATASPAGVVNVVDNRIPTAIPEKGYEGEIFSRYNTASNEKLLTAGTTVGLGNNVAVRMEGLVRRADNYAVPSLVINAGEDPVKRLPDSYNNSNVGTLGLSWVGSRGHLGVSVSERQDKYGLVGHNHMFDYCAPHLFNSEYPSYLNAYPHLYDPHHINVTDLHDMHCGNNHADNPEHSHDNIYGHHHEHGEKGPWVDLKSRRYDLRGEWLQPIVGIDKVRLSATYSKYHHDERGDGKLYLSEYEKNQIANGYMPSYIKNKIGQAEFMKNNPESIYDNKGLNTRLEITHQPVGDANHRGELKGHWGIQYQTQTSSVKRPYILVSDSVAYGERQPTGRLPLVENTLKQYSIFGLEQYKLKNFTFELAGRAERQEIPIKYDLQHLANVMRHSNDTLPSLDAYKKDAFSYAGTLLWDFKPNYRFSLTASHNERLPTPMELYYHGKHLATNSYQYGNRHLDKEKSNNFELGLMYQGDQWDYKLSAYYNRFKNYIHNENLYREGNLFQRRYTQSKANIYGIEGEISYRFVPEQQITLYGDYVYGKLSKLPKFVGDNIYSEGYDCIKTDEDGEYEDICYDVIGVETITPPNRYAPRMPPARLGLTLKSDWNDAWTTYVDLMRVFDQNKTSTALWIKEKSNDDETKQEGAKLKTLPIPEDSTKGYTMLNLGVDYKRQWRGLDYRVSFNANNLLNEKVYIHNSYLPYVPQMGRNFNLGLNVKF